MTENIKTGDRVTVLTYQDARPAYNGEVTEVLNRRYSVRNDETTEIVDVPKDFVVPERKPGEAVRRHSGEYVGSMLEGFFPMELPMSGELANIDHFVYGTAPSDDGPGDGPKHEFKINIGEQWYTVTVEETE